MTAVTAADSTPRVWVGCLGCYNAGQLAGEWFDAVDAPTEMTGGAGSWDAEIDERQVTVHLDHYRDAHEELWVFDSEGFAGMLTGECSPTEARELAERVEVVDSEQRDAFAAHVANVGAEYATPENFEDAYCGEYDSEIAWAWDYLEESGMLAELPAWASAGAVVDAWCHDAFLDGMTSCRSGAGTVYVFRSI